jgi:hypothetical protein
MAILTKKEILEGRNNTQTLFVESYGADVVIRPLTDGELTGIFEVIGSIPLNEDGTPNLSEADITKNLRALQLATSLGMMEPALTPDEVAGMKFGVPEYIGTKILVLSGMASTPEVKKKDEP